MPRASSLPATDRAACVPRRMPRHPRSRNLAAATLEPAGRERSVTERMDVSTTGVGRTRPSRPPQATSTTDSPNQGRDTAGGSPLVAHLLDLQRTAGNRAIATVLGPAAASTPRTVAIQRIERWQSRPSGQDAHRFDPALTKLSSLVETAATTAQNLDNLSPSIRKFAIFHAAYDKYALDPSKVPRLLYARYGYAVEELVNIDVDHGALQASLPPGTRAQTQGGRGMTRPDVVVSEGDGPRQRDVAWFDISSAREDDTLHIWNKVGWDRIRYTGEAQYTRLVPTALRSGGSSNRDARAIARGVKAQRREELARCTEVDGFIDRLYARSPQAFARRRLSIELGLTRYFGLAEKLTPRSTRAVLNLIGRAVFKQGNYWTVRFYQGTTGSDRSDWPHQLVTTTAAPSADRIEEVLDAVVPQPRGAKRRLDDTGWRDRDRDEVDHSSEYHADADAEDPMMVEVTTTRGVKRARDR
ncbi:hypothetical protein ACGGZK_10445 [Agromyces sp. MMS24-K17]|uniref:hypothetical protein n=1 Tax=Agromyces sp. MMS24-K17 TaxID=3372850 RepID=UPI003754A45D